MCSVSSEKFTLKDPIYKGKMLWEDPFKDEPAGVLLSDRMAFYAEKFGLVVPFNSENLRPAQYTLCVGKKCYYDGKTSKIDKKNPVEIAPNGLVYIQIYEYFNIPYYMIARYSLRVEQVYRGLIVDNGLQVDPGFHGYINVPVYNFTNELKTLEFKERLLSVDFVKTTPFRPDPSINGKEEREWVRSGLVNTGGYPLKVFKENPDKLYHSKAITSYFRDEEKNESSVMFLHKQVNSACKTIKRYRNIGVIGGLALLVAILGYIYQTHVSVAQARIDAENARSAVKLQQVEVEKKYEKINVEITELEEKGIELQNKISELENSLSELQNKKEKQGN